MSSELCCGCTACASVCPKKCISFCIDEEGFKIPKVDEEKCIDCGLCKKTCPALNSDFESVLDFEQKTYAFQYLDDRVRKKSASGALFPAFANFFIKNLNGYVCGCILDENLMPRHILSNRCEDIQRMQDSKYVQSDMTDVIDNIGILLKDEKFVLFTGTSCQVSGLYAYLNRKDISSERLLTIDFFCHGVSSPLIWKEYLNYYEVKTSRKVIGYRFRNKKDGWGKTRATRGSCFLSTVFYKQANKTKFDDVSFIARHWRNIFFSNLCIRKYCHHCPYANINKPADITMGDFWGIEFSHPNFDDHKGCSLALIRNDKAFRWFTQLPNSEYIEVTIKDVIERQGNAFEPSRPNSKRDIFWKDYFEFGFPYVFKKYFGGDFKSFSKDIIKYILYLLHIKNYG